MWAKSMPISIDVGLTLTSIKSSLKPSPGLRWSDRPLSFQIHLMQPHCCPPPHTHNRMNFIKGLVGGGGGGGTGHRLGNANTNAQRGYPGAGSSGSSSTPTSSSSSPRTPASRSPSQQPPQHVEVTFTAEEQVSRSIILFGDSRRKQPSGSVWRIRMMMQR